MPALHKLSSYRPFDPTIQLHMRHLNSVCHKWKSGPSDIAAGVLSPSGNTVTGTAHRLQRRFYDSQRSECVAVVMTCVTFLSCQFLQTAISYVRKTQFFK
jgi:hypothetical protein